MDQNLPRLYSEYGKYSNWRNMPCDLDGLKPVERRVLLSAYKVARGKYAKSRQVDSYTTGHYHPHGSCYGTIVQMVRQGFLIGQGNFGTNVGVEVVGAAADRYTECQMNPWTIDLAFKYVKYVPWQETELNDTEPIYLPTMFPFCLMGNDYTQGIGFGFKTYVPCFDIKDLHKRLLWLLGHRKTKPIIAPITDCKILSDQKTLDKLLTTGKAKIDVEGIVEIDKKSNVAVLKSWPPGKRFESFLNKFSKELSEGLIGFTDLSVNETNIVFQVLRERNRDKIFNEFIEKLSEVVKGAISFETMVVDLNQNVKLKSIDEMLLDTYNMFSETNENMLKSEVSRIDDIINEYNILATIRPIIADGITKKMTPDEIVRDIESKAKVDVKTSTELMGKYRISKLLSLDIDTNDLQKEKKQILDNLAEIDKFVLEQYNGIS